MPIHIIDEQDEFCVVYKPPEISTHQKGDSSAPALTQLLRSQHSHKTLFPVHRLDKATSGLLLLAKSESANSILSKMFEDRQVDKIYIALSKRKPRKKQGLVAGDLVKSRNGCWKLSRSMKSPSITQFYSRGGVGETRLFVLKPHTGKTHQLRVVLKSLGAPILGDKRYGSDHSDRCYLHAFGLRFTYGGREYVYTALPTEGIAFSGPLFEQALRDFSDPFKLPWPDVSVG